MIVDIHEPKEIIDRLLPHGFRTQDMKVGDFLVGDILIERKRMEDILNSVNTPRLASQLLALKEAPGRKRIFVSGDFPSSYSAQDRHLYKEVLSLAARIETKWDIPVSFFPSDEDLCNYLIILQQKFEKDESSILDSLYRYKPSILDSRLRVLCSFPGIGVKTARKVLEVQKVGVKKFISLSNEEMLTLGLTRKQVEKVQEVLRDG